MKRGREGGRKREGGMKRGREGERKRKRGGEKERERKEKERDEEGWRRRGRESRKREGREEDRETVLKNTLEKIFRHYMTGQIEFCPDLKHAKCAPPKGVIKWVYTSV